MSCELFHQSGLLRGKEGCASQELVCSEMGKTFELLAEEADVCCVHVDNCLIRTSEYKKCDYLFFHRPSQRLIFVELKGRDVERALEQLSMTLSFVAEKLDISQYQIDFVIVSSAVPNEADQRLRFFKEEFRKLGIRLRRYTRYGKMAV